MRYGMTVSLETYKGTNEKVDVGFNQDRRRTRVTELEITPPTRTVNTLTYSFKVGYHVSKCTVVHLPTPILFL